MSIVFEPGHGGDTLLLCQEFRVCGGVRHEKETGNAEYCSDRPLNCYTALELYPVTIFLYSHINRLTEEDPWPIIVATILNLGESRRQKPSKGS